MRDSTEGGRTSADDRVASAQRTRSRRTPPARDARGRQPWFPMARNSCKAPRMSDSLSIEGEERQLRVIGRGEAAPGPQPCSGGLQDMAVGGPSLRGLEIRLRRRIELTLRFVEHGPRGRERKPMPVRERVRQPDEPLGRSDVPDAGTDAGTRSARKCSRYQALRSAARSTSSMRWAASSFLPSASANPSRGDGGRDENLGSPTSRAGFRKWAAARTPPRAFRGAEGPALPKAGRTHPRTPRRSPPTTRSRRRPDRGAHPSGRGRTAGRAGRSARDRDLAETPLTREVLGSARGLEGAGRTAVDHAISARIRSGITLSRASPSRSAMRIASSRSRRRRDPREGRATPR